MLVPDRVVFVEAPLRRDVERRRWYGDDGEGCLVLTVRGRLLEPCPTFRPRAYRLLACRATFDEAHAYALGHRLHHLRTL